MLIKNKSGILEVCEALHTSNTGTSDILDDYKYWYNWLYMRYFYWEEWAKFTVHYDNAVKNLVFVTLEECKGVCNGNSYLCNS